jgi:hypothetical protein
MSSHIILTEANFFSDAVNVVWWHLLVMVATLANNSNLFLLLVSSPHQSNHQTPIGDRTSKKSINQRSPIYSKKTAIAPQKTNRDRLTTQQLKLSEIASNRFYSLI